MSGQPIAPLSPAQLAEVAQWFETNAASLPPAVAAALSQHRALVAGIKGSQQKLSQILTELRRALGILPSSERRSSGDPLGPVSQGDGLKPKDKRAQLEVGVKRNNRLRDWHRDLAAQKDAKAIALSEKISAMTEDEFKFERTPEQQAQHAREVEAETERMMLGDGPEPSLQSVAETLMTGSPLSTAERELTLEADVGQSDGNIAVLGEILETRQRYDFSFSLTRVTVNLKKKVVLGEDGERQVISPSTAELGPKGYSVTWGFLAHMAVLVVQYAMPLNRLGRLLSTDAKRFSAGMLGRLLHYVAVRLAAIYLELADQLADSEILTGDDTSCRVVQVSKHFAQSEGEVESPWSHFSTPAAAFESVAAGGDTSLACKLGAEFQFESERSDGKGKKRALNTTTISGRSVADDPRSLIVWYRSHLGGFGNLLEMFLRKRKPTATELTTQSDLASVNLVQDPELLKRFRVLSAGCMSHARRPFAIHEQEDPVFCDLMLHQFKGLALHEQGLSLVGRNWENVAAMRNVDSRAIWEKIKDVAVRMTKRWSRATKLGNAARYIIKNYEKLTAYLDDPRLELTNNFSERMLRMEKQMEKSSMFRTTLEGRFALDIVRTVLQTAVAAGVPVEKYLLHVLTADPARVAANPANFTPRAWALQLQDAVQPAPAENDSETVTS